MQPTKKQLAASDKKINDALDILQSHNRGLNVLADLKRMCVNEGQACGLDSEGMWALKTLVSEFAAGRREFFSRISRVVLPPKPGTYR